MDKTTKFVLPSPKFEKTETAKPKPTLPHFLSPQGMLLPRQNQPPPMYGPRGSTVPPRFLGQYKPNQFQNRNKFNGNDSNRAPNQGDRGNFRNNKRENYCETCERDFRSSNELETHRSQHQTCGVEGCKFTAHAAIVSKHVEQQHNSGLYDKIKKLSSPEEISKWRDERKKRYPTRANVELRQKAQEERMKRGERLEANKNRFGKHEDRRKMWNAEKKEGQEERNPRPENERRKRNRRRDTRGSRNIEEVKKTVEEEMPVVAEKTVTAEEEVMNGNLPMFRGTSNLRGYKKPKAAKKAETNALSGLLGMYGSDEEESAASEDDEESEKSIGEIEKTEDEPGVKKQKFDDETEALAAGTEEIVVESSEEHPMVEKSEKSPEPIEMAEEPISNLSDNEAPLETPVAKSSGLPDNPYPKPEKLPKRPPQAKERPKVVRKSGLNYKHLRTRQQNTMLEKLLETDIRHERNVLLQCVRFVAENKFFGIESDEKK